jgi:hypothetical protein
MNNRQNEIYGDFTTDDLPVEDNSENCANTHSHAKVDVRAPVDNGANSELLDAADLLKSIPRPSKEQLNDMLYGVIGEFAKSAAEGKGLNPVATAIGCMTWLSAELSPRPVIAVGDIYHPCRIYAVHVGRSSRGGKGDSLNLVKKVHRQISLIDPTLLAKSHTGGISTREGLALELHDGYGQGDSATHAIQDKRLFIIEPEFAQVLSQGKREGNTLMTALRDCWDDGGVIKPLTKNSRIWSTDPHIAIFGNITPFELRSKLTINEVHGGTLNRFLLIFAERLDYVPIPEVTSEVVVEAYAHRFIDIIRYAKSNYGSSGYDHISERSLLTMTHEAKAYWLHVYAELVTPFVDDLIAAATDRRHAYALRLALLFALTDKSSLIELPHLKAGVAWVKFAALCTQYVLSDGADDSALPDPKNSEKLIQYLRSVGGSATRSQITKNCFKRHLSGKALDAVLQPLLDRGVLDKRTEQPKAGGTLVSVYSLVS